MHIRNTRADMKRGILSRKTKLIVRIIGPVFQEKNCPVMKGMQSMIQMMSMH